MPLRKTYVLSLAGVFAVLGSSCASPQRPPPAEQPNPEQQRSLTQAQDAQTQVVDQQNKVAAAHQEVVKQEQQLAEAQRKESEQRARLQQLQQQSGAPVQQSEQQAWQAEAAAPQASGPGARAISGNLLQATPRQLVLQARDGRTMTLDVNDRTRVLIGDELRSTADLQQGASARVAYDDNAGRPTATMIQVQRAGSGAAQAPAAAPGTGSDATRSPAPTGSPGSTAVPVPGTDRKPGTGY